MRWPPRDTPEMGHPGAGGVRSDTNYIRYPQVEGLLLYPVSYKLNVR